MNITASFLDFIVTTQKQNTPMHINKTPPKTKWRWSREKRKEILFFSKTAPPFLSLSLFFIKRIYCSSFIAYAEVSDLYPSFIFFNCISFYYSHFKKLEHNCFTILCWLLLYKGVSRLHVYIYTLPLEPPSHPHPHSSPLGHHRAPSWAPCAT